VAKFSESGVKHGGILGIDEESAEFSFGGRGDNDTHDVAVHVDSTVDR
jgi:hypothetical protein